MATALKKLLETARDMYKKMEDGRFGTTFALRTSKLFVLEQLIKHPASDQALIDMIDLDIQKGVKAELEAMKMSITESSLETLLKIIKNCALANTAQLTADQAKVANLQLLESNARLMTYDTNHEFTKALNELYVEISAKQQRFVSTDVEPVEASAVIQKVVYHDEAELIAADMQGLRKVISDLASLNEALTYSNDKKANDVLRLMGDLNANIANLTQLQEKLVHAENYAEQQTAEMATLKLNLQQVQNFRQEQKQIEEELRKQVQMLNINLKTTSFKATEEISALQSQLAELQETLNSKEELHQNNIESLQYQLAHSQKTFTNKEELYQTKIASLSEGAATLDKTNKALITQLKTARSQLVNFNDALAKSVSRTTELEGKLEQTNNAFDALLSDFQTVKEQLRQLQQEKLLSSSATRSTVVAAASSTNNHFSFHKKNKSVAPVPRQMSEQKSSDTKEIASVHRHGIKISS